MAREITERRRAKLERVLRWRQKDLTLVLANIHDPHNVSAIYRSADAFGVAALHLYYTDTAFPELGGGAAGKGTGKDALSGDAVLEEALDAAHKGAGFAGTGAREYQHGVWPGLDGFLLRFGIRERLRIGRRLGRRGRCFGLGLLLFVGCDLCVGLHNLAAFLPVVDTGPLFSFAQVGMWLFYLPSQVLITLSVRKK